MINEPKKLGQTINLIGQNNKSNYTQFIKDSHVVEIFF